MMECSERTDVNFLRGVSSSGVVEVLAVNESEVFTCSFPSCTEGVLGVNELQLASFGVFFGCCGSVCSEQK